VLPLLYLHGLCCSDFGPALEQFLGSAAGLSPATITRLTRDWQDQATAFNKRPLKDTDYVCVWVDGIYLKVCLEQDKVCLLVMIGVRADGTKELIALDDGHRESDAPLMGEAFRITAPMFYWDGTMTLCSVSGAVVTADLLVDLSNVFVPPGQGPRRLHF